MSPPLPLSPSLTYQTLAAIDLYEGPDCRRLATQAAPGRYLMPLEPFPATATHQGLKVKALKVRLCEDEYPAWLAVADIAQLTVAPQAYQAPVWTAAEIRDRLPEVIAFTQAAMAVPNTYLWGGTVAPNYDCSGLMQAAFAASGIWLPRDAYQQAAFCTPVARSDLQVGDLVFFGTAAKITHVGVYLGGDRYLHSSGQDQGRNGIGIDWLIDSEDPISQAYLAQFRGGGRVTRSYHPGDNRLWLDQTR
ncbi:C40 family peptidase [Trichothermofontia sp.]